ncbi:transglycosylase domain-containing protein [Eggerthellaceae bacterium 3-80]|nr:penicillin-binding protein [bacterium D16-34]
MGSRSIKNRPSAKKKHPFVGVLSVLIVLFVCFAAGIFGVYAVGSAWIGDLTDYDVTAVESLNTAQPSEVYASDGTTLLARFQLENRDPVRFDDISEYVKEGTVATEDERFYEHGGFDVMGIARAVIVTLTGSGREGASTITQQFVRNTILSEEMNEISLKRKVREIYLSVKLEENYSKDAILLMYLNTINYGSGAYGIQAASQRYFSKNAKDLTLAEAAALVGIPQSPTNNNPLDNYDACVARRNLVLDRMRTNGYISQEQCDAAQAEELVLNPSLPANDGIVKYPYFASYVRDEVMDSYSQVDLFSGGLTIVTTLDLSMQEAAEQAIDEKEETLDPAISGALVAIDPSNGYVKALVGGKDYYENQTNLATGQGTNGGRPCGSAFKTFTLITALEEGVSPQTLLDCTSPSVIPNTDYNENNALKNIDNINYGTQTMQGAFAVSANTGFVRLQMALGTQKVIDTAKKLGITSPLMANPSLTLGQSNVTMLDMADAYATIGNGGVHYDPQPILEIYDSSGNLIVDNSRPSGERVISEEIAHAAIEVMKTVVTQGTGTEARLANGQDVAAKTGTSSDYKDITFCGVTPQLSVAIWFGDPSNVEALPAHVSAADVFRNFMTEVLKGQDKEEFFDADDPTYDLTFSNSTYHVGNYYSSQYSAGPNNFNNTTPNILDEPKETETNSSDNEGDTQQNNTNNNSEPKPQEPTTQPQTPQPGTTESGGSSEGTAQPTPTPTTPDNTAGAQDAQNAQPGNQS